MIYFVLFWVSATKETEQPGQIGGRWNLRLSGWINDTAGSTEAAHVHTLWYSIVRGRGGEKESAPTEGHLMVVQAVPLSLNMATLVMTDVTPGAPGSLYSQGQSSSGAWLTRPWPRRESFSPSPTVKTSLKWRKRSDRLHLYCTLKTEDLLVVVCRHTIESWLKETAKTNQWIKEIKHYFYYLCSASSCHLFPLCSALPVCVRSSARPAVK